MRTFLGISIPEEVKEQLTSICYGLPDVRWVLKENFHITLVFLGEQSNEQVDILSEFCSQISFPEFDLNLKSVGTFERKSPSILFTTLNFSPELLQFQKTLDSGARRLGLSPDRQEYRPHLTIGRFKNSNKTRILEYLEEFADFASSNFRVSEFHIYSSKTFSDGPVYSIEESFSLLPSYKNNKRPES
ncbi:MULTISPECIES: RNA 2',3'-cyclic phosphodiesterase [Leptospira]|uniref:RNA 2',3'-cyclic phosphodiesterase n=2 Tax=Leptospira weilii TaxID=28184 RepID=A0A828Z192_9LEPT|nr:MULTISPECIES: RNA 2',3'-cyclic phosphodiesterase [Leptospira]EKR64154.1 2'-5' RNA ligase [Leptospira weilii str. 2006001853]EMJ61248.1 2'-5' RNA ligase [Leptospira sp. P2653]EMN45871.1 2'-5' RNA ligase [Leptospira weilii str. LNT 1234]EMN91670.1 2'-5' RNA ligase [Leptospira weilii str. UI 13098]MDL5247286.1 RNA 2',3'-cyclic phosphodiesterase [Leptospira weilii]